MTSRIQNSNLANHRLEWRRQEAAYQAEIAELRQQNAALNSFAETVAHDLKNPLGTLVGLTTLLDAYIKANAPADIVTLSHSIVSSGNQALTIVEELLHLGKTDLADLDIGPLNMVAILAEAMTTQTERIVDQTAEIEVQPTFPNAIGYAPWIVEVWRNLLSNALKYGGAPCQIYIGAEQNGAGYTRFFIRDNGAGLGPEQIDQLFQPYTRFHDGPEEGTGLGLSIIRRIINRLGGEVGVISQPDAGSEFWFTLPTSLNHHPQRRPFLDSEYRAGQTTALVVS